jgi:DNA-binding phage protein
MQHTLQNLSRPVLKELARARGLSQQGRKADVADRLIEHGFTESDLPEIGTEAEPEAAAGVRILVCPSAYNPARCWS